MDLDFQLRDIALLGGLVLQLAGLAVVIYPLRRVNPSIRVSAQAALHRHSSGIRSLRVEHPEPRAYRFDGVEIRPDEARYSRVRTLAEMVLDDLEPLVIQQESLRPEEQAARSRFVCRRIQRRPIMQELLHECPESYCDELVRLCHEVDRAST
ncbi:hypothetical protein HFP89_10420 [Wenzhouxiangella sp. XN79A]|uniref:hypothetical protein n=1 Tax=Wenzhouxiangella sp. XN79A TaxID=2724193 RepID=UPI00144A4E4D|nr:hypothetical protein [Wenzhouxiangella sp. XN79A]NKI35579.1 hypothetical protein [Wenzhouxiangella sp. XN79A]